MSLDDEIRDHLERETEDNIDRGMTPEEARYAARRKFGNVTRVKEQTREVWRRVWLEQLLQDLRYGLRTLRRNPVFTLVAILTLALGIGMNSAVFSVVNSVLLRPLDYPHPERLVWLADYDPNIKRDVASSPDFAGWRRQARSYSAMGAYSYQPVTIVTSRDAVQVNGVAIGGDFWRLTGAKPALGRLFAPEEQDALVLSWDLFQGQFGGDIEVVGKPVTVDSRAVTIAGVLPRDFRFQFPIWWPVAGSQAVEAYLPLPPADVQRFRMVNVAAALKPGVGVAAANAELQVIQRRIVDQRSGPARGSLSTTLRVEPLAHKLSSAARQPLFILLAAAAFVLLIACANIAALLLARAAARRREIAIRAAVGAGRARIIRQMLTESVVLALLGGAAGLLLAQWAISILIRLAPDAVPRLAEATLDLPVLAFTAIISIATGLLFGAGPAVSLRRANLHDALQEGTRGSTGLTGLRARRLLVGAEIALAIVLLTGAGLMLKSFWRMYTHPPGFAPESVLTMRVRLAGPQYAAKPAQEAYMIELLHRLQAAPGVKAAGISNWYLFDGVPAFPADTVPDRTHVVRLNASSPGYLQALGMRLVKGRWLTDQDRPGSALLNESMAREAFGRADPIGRVLSVPQPVTIVGLVADLKYSQLDAEAPPEIYVPFQQGPLRGTGIAVRAAGDPAALAPMLRKVIAGIDPAQPVYNMKTLERALADSIAPRRFNLFLLATFAATALLLALVGIYGVIAYSVAARSREIGVRIALGAQRREVVRMVVIEGMSVALAGIAAGLAAAWGLTRLMAGLLYAVQANDPWTFAAVALSLAAAALIACWAPAMRAARVDPTVALRWE